MPPSLPPFGQRELDIMQTLWRRGASTVADVHSELSGRGIRVAYTTVQTMLNRLEAKGHVRRDPTDRAHRFMAVARERTVVGAALRGFLQRYFDGSAGELATHLVERGLPSTELDRLQEIIASRRRGRSARR